MVIRTALVAIVFLVTGCTRDWDGRGAGVAALEDSAGQLLTAAAAPATRARGTAKFASLPDRGELLVYPDTHSARRDGAYTWYRTELSEAHALRAIGERKLRITTPSGETLSFDYERHVEHPSGDWTWIGRLEGGEPSDEIILTFGERAAFGSIAQPNKDPLRLTVRNGVSWLVETDGTAISAIDNAATRPRRPDYLIPPKLGRLGMTAAASAGESLETSSAAATPTSAPVVDIVLGYTSGFAAALGGTSQANTRLFNLIDITNQAYVNSQVNAQVRLVRTVQVSYPDATDNNLALEDLTGYRDGNSIPVPAALQALRAARDQYGADLVSLVRKFKDPENVGCGIAWLLGADRHPEDISGSDDFAYSIVSDGTDAGTDGKTYYCRDETLAHEFGHNMGSTHDRETSPSADDYGAYAYSFGYKTDVGMGNFYTIMAYGDSGQTRFRVFSNPRITFCGTFACGVENVADNARSLTQTIPIAAGFRATVVVDPPPSPSPPKATHDFDGDGKSDILWRNTSSGTNTIWKSGDSATQQAVATVALAWKIAGTGDFDGDGRSDILWRNSSTGANSVWRSGNSATSQSVTKVADLNWTVAGVGDFDGDGKADILWRNLSDGANTIWKSGDSATQQAVATVALAWKVAGAGDFDGDGRSDILWRHSSTGANSVWRSGNSATSQSVTKVADLNWTITGVGDFDGDGKADILWRNLSDGTNTIWKSGNSTIQQAVTTQSVGWKATTVGDYDGDGRADILWRHSSTGANSVWRSGSSATSQYLSTVASSAWVIAP